MLFLLLLLALSLAPPLARSVCAQVTFADENKFDGSEFSKPSFVDTNFNLPDYKELQPSGRSSMSPWMRKDERLSADESAQFEEQVRPNSKKQGSYQGISPAGSGEGEISTRVGSEGLDEMTHMAPVYDLAGDWVPDSLHLTSNGGFSNAPFNGSPVPYRLNGHPDIQRGVP